jgi:hypothetical protein
MTPHANEALLLSCGLNADAEEEGASAVKPSFWKGGKRTAK